MRYSRYPSYGQKIRLMQMRLQQGRIMCIIKTIVIRYGVIDMEVGNEDRY